MDSQWLNIIGLVSDIIGAIMLSYGLIISKKKAIELGLARWADEKKEKNLKQPQIQDRIKQSRNAIIGLFFLVTGFIIQIIANWPKT